MDQQNPAQPATPASQPAIETVPTTWPGGFGLFKHSKAAVMLNIWTIVALYVLTIIVSIALRLVSKDFGPLISEIINEFIGVSITITLFASIRGEKISAGQALTKVQPLIVGKYIVCNIIVGFLLILSFLLLVVPFFIVLPRLLLATYLLVDQDLGPIEAVRESWNLSKNNAGKIYGILAASIAMGLLVLTIIGIPFAIYFVLMYSAALPILSLFLLNQQSDQTEPVAN